MRIVLTIAGSDSGGGAGIQADLKTFHRFGVFGTSAITAVTAQNTEGVREWMALPAALVAAQIEAVATDLRPDAVKSGMLGTAAVIAAAAASITAHALHPYVLDPVMVASSGDALLERDAVGVLRSALLPVCDLITPNIEEAMVLTGEGVASVSDQERAARRLVEEGAPAALVKGGHAAGAEVADVLFDGARGVVRVFRHRRIDSRHTHGTGCTLSAAIAAHLALGVPLERAVETSLDFVHRAIAGAPGLGAGRGPLNHFA
ncbi:MAG TPA: bifunctional hydroxymethylpyrimidine kinase/phosphomethylpyrimidine kinase [Gemmatimonadaceae bacterium]|nr:bifunctional hydroxymethylpyrimidine kinase/phosphomethylpyrimidine kinase [Gemmatimonadaceae bacterium]